MGRNGGVTCVLGGMSDVGPCHVDGKEVYGPYVCGLWRWSSVGESDDMFMRAACGMPGEYIVVSRGVGVDQCHVFSVHHT